jgi:hypothetical protein
LKRQWLFWTIGADTNSCFYFIPHFFEGLEKKFKKRWGQKMENLDKLASLDHPPSITNRKLFSSLKTQRDGQIEYQ